MTDEPETETNAGAETNLSGVPSTAADDPAERPGAASSDSERGDELVDEWEEESFPASDPPAHY